MPYKTILVHLNDKRRAEALLEPAIALASRYNAHLIGMHVYSSVPAPPIPVPYGSQVLGARGHGRAQGDRGDRRHVRAHDGQAAVRGGVAGAEGAARRPRRRGDGSRPRCRPDRRRADRSRLGFVAAAATSRSGWRWRAAGRCWSCPMSAAIPRSAAMSSSPGSRGANRRAPFSTPCLCSRARRRCISSRSRSAGTIPRVLAPDTSIAAALARHGIKPSVRTSVAADISIGDEILSRLADLGADLLVMGAYGHSRMREMVFGGVTRHITRHMTVPTLLSH